MTASYKVLLILQADSTLPIELCNMVYVSDTSCEKLVFGHLKNYH